MQLIKWVDIKIYANSKNLCVVIHRIRNSYQMNASHRKLDIVMQINDQIT